MRAALALLQLALVVVVVGTIAYGLFLLYLRFNAAVSTFPGR